MFTTSYVPKHLKITPTSCWLVFYQLFTPSKPKRLKKSENKIDTFIQQFFVIVQVMLFQAYTRVQCLIRWIFIKANTLYLNMASFKGEIYYKFANKYFAAKIYCFVYMAVMFITLIFPIFVTIVENPVTNSTTITEKEKTIHSATLVEENNAVVYAFPVKNDVASLELSEDTNPKIIETFETADSIEKIFSNKEIISEDKTPQQSDVTLEENNSLVSDISQEKESILAVGEEDSIPTVGVEIELNGSIYSVSPVVYIHVDDNLTSPLQVSTTRIADNDVMVDLSNPFEDRFVYNQITAELEKAISRLTYAESGNQPFDGQLYVAEDIRNSLFSGVYGGDLDATCKKQYFTSLIIESDSSVHLYRNGVELLETSESTDAAAKLAVRGTNVTGIILEACTEIRSEQYPNWNLNESYYANGAYFHYAPDLLSEKQLASRIIEQIPVSFSFVDHVFYSKWLNAKYALS